MGKGATRTNEEMQNQILGQFQAIARKAGKQLSEEEKFEKLPLKDRIRIQDEKFAAERLATMEAKKLAHKNKTGVRDTWWSRGTEIRKIKMLEQRALLV